MAISKGDGAIILKTKVDTDGAKAGLSSLKSIIGKAGKAIMVAGAAATVALTKMSVDAYAEFEQLVGGVETLFKSSAGKVLKYANEAYKTTGMSANEYMKNVTSFSASLLQSVGGDTEKAAEIANDALISMSDNANKFGTDQESVLNAFQGFAKGQYMLLDNLKLGYGGTKTEMERLLKDAQAITGVKYDIDNLADVYTAIGVIQEKLGVAGTTAKEAATTISGSAAMMKASWQNVLIAISGGGDMDAAIENFTDSLATYFENIVPVVEKALSGIGELISKVAPKLVEKVAAALIEAIPQLLNAIYQMIVGLAKGIIDGIKALFSGTSKEVAKEEVKAIDEATKSQNKLTDAVEETANAQEKSLAGFDTLQTITSTASESIETPNTEQLGGVDSSGGVFGEISSEAIRKVSDEYAQLMALVGISLVTIGVLLLFTGNVGWGVGFIIAGATEVGASMANVSEETQKKVISTLTTITGAIAGALVAIGIMLIMLGSKAMGVGFIAAGATTLIGTVAALIGFDVADVTSILNTITAVASGALLALGIMLCIFSGPSPKSIGLIAAGAAGLVMTIALNFNAVKKAVSGTLGEIMVIAGAALLVLGIILCCMGVSIPLGIGLIAAGAASLVTVATIDSNAIVNMLQGPIGDVMLIGGALLIFIGILLCCTGAGLGLGIGCILAGVTLLGTYVAANWDEIYGPIKEVIDDIEQWFSDLWEDIKEGWETVVDFISTLWDVVGKTSGMSGLEMWDTKDRAEKILEILERKDETGRKLAQYLKEHPEAYDDYVYRGVKIPGIPGLANGAVIPGGKPFLAMLGDQPSGHTNIEAPLDTIVEAFNIAQGKQSIQIEFTGNMSQLIRVLNPQIKAENKRASVFVKG